jgi:hypothetical protein
MMINVRCFLDSNLECEFMTRLSQDLGNGCIKIFVKKPNLHGANADAWGIDDLTI